MMSNQLRHALGLTAAALLLTARGHAAPSDGPQLPHSRAARPGQDPWRRFHPTPLALELGGYAGAALFASHHNLQDLAAIEQPPAQGHQALGPGLDLGVRAALFPLAWLGAEADLGFIRSETRASSNAVTIWTYRLQAVLQCPAFRWVPFVAFGAGGMNLTSDKSALGRDSDPELHVGLGVKYSLTQSVLARFDVRDNLMQKDRTLPGAKDGDLVHHFELLLGASFSIGRSPAVQPAAPPLPAPAAPSFPSPAARPAPAPAAPAPSPPAPPATLDSDHDGIADVSDPCPSEAEDHAPPHPNDGCPNDDWDGDGVLNALDACPQEPGPAPRGCPAADSAPQAPPSPSDVPVAPSPAPPPSPNDAPAEPAAPSPTPAQK